MSPPEPPPDDPGQPATCPSDLTQAKKDGTPYARFPDVEAEIRGALRQAPSAWVTNRFKSETLVHLIREFWRRADSDEVVGRLVEPLGRRIAVVVGDYSKGFSAAEREEIEEHVRGQILELLFADEPSRTSEFLEVAFKTAVKRRTLNEVERRRASPRELQFVTPPDDEGRDPSAQVPDDAPGPDELLVWKDAKEKLPDALKAIPNPKHREAVILHYLRGWPISSKDPAAATLCTHFAPITERQIHTWLKRGLEKLREALGEMS